MVNVFGKNSVDGTPVRHKEQNRWQLSGLNQDDSVTDTGTADGVLDQVQKIRRALLLGDRREEFMQHEHHRLGAEEEAQEHHLDAEISTSRNDDNDEGERLSSPLQSLRISNVGDIGSLGSSWTRKTDVELEVEKLALQVQSLVHQLTTCRQNLVKAEREVSMLHQENVEFRSLLHDILETFSSKS